MAGKMLRAGLEPVLVTNNPVITTAINRDGIRVEEAGDTYTTPTIAYTLLDDVPQDAGPFDVVYLAMKANTVLAFAAQVYPLLAPEGFVVTLQNGIVEEIVGEAVGPDRVVSGIIGWGGTMLRAGHYAKTSPGATHLGEMSGEMTARLQQAGTEMSLVSEVRHHRNIRGALWSKLAINCVITTIGAITGQTLGEMLKRPEARRLFLQTYTEVVDTAHALGVRLERITADPMMLYCPADAGSFARFKKDIVARIVGYRYGAVKSSMLQSLERSRPTEIDYLNGYVVEQAAAVGIPTPVNAALVAIVKEIERGEYPFQPANLNLLRERLGIPVG